MLEFTLGGNGTPLVRITIVDVGGGSFEFSLEQIGSGVDGTWVTGDLKGEIRGLFFDMDDNASGTAPVLSNLVIDEGRPASGTTSTAIATGGTGEDDVTGFAKTNSEVNMNGAGLPEDGGYDVGVAIGTSGIGIKGDDVQGVTFQLTWPAGSGVSLDDFGNEDFGIRMMSIGAVNSSETFITSRDGSAKIVGTSDHVFATLSVGDVTIDEGAGYAVFTVSLSNPSSGDISFDLALANGTATAADYGPTLEYFNGTAWVSATSATILAGETTLLVRTPVTDDLLDEIDQTFTLTATVTSGPATNAADSGVATILDNDAPTEISIAADAVSVDESAGTITFTVTRTGDAEGSQSVDYSLGGDVEAADLGGSLAGGTVTFLQGETSKTITLTLTDDALDEIDEVVTVTLSNPAGSQVAPTIGTAAASTTILDNDAPTEISIAADAVSVDESAGTITFTVTRTGDAEGSQSVDYSLGGDVEAADLGGSLAGGTVTFLQGETSKTITLTLTDDALDEIDEVVTVTLSNPSGSQVNPTIGTAAASTTILDNDAPTEISIAADAVSVDESAGTITFTVTRTGDAEGSQSVDYSLGGDVEAADLGGSLAGGTITFLQGETSKTITLTLTDDALDEIDEVVTVTLSNPSGSQVNPTIGTAAASTTVLDNDAPTEISIAADAVSVDESAGTITFTVTRTGDAEGSQSVDYSLGGDVEASDLGGSLAGGTITFLQGETSKTITLTLTDDVLDEIDEVVTVTLSNPSGSEVNPTIGTAAASTTVLDNDAPTEISIAADAVSVDESAGTITFTVTRTGDAEGSQSVDYSLGGDVEASDLGGSLAGGTITFLQGETSKTITLTLTDDVLDEIDEVVTVTLSNPSGSEVNPTIGTAAASTTVLDNDAPTEISIAADAVSVDESAGTITFTVTRTGDAEGSQSVDYSLGGDVEAADLGGSLAGGTITFLQGETSKTITLTLTDDALDEIDEVVTVTLSNPSGSQVAPTIGTAAASTTIIDNDAAPASPTIAAPALLYWSDINDGNMTPINRISFQDLDSTIVQVTLAMDDSGDVLTATSVPGVVTVGGSWY